MNSDKKQNRHSAALKKNVVGLTGILIVMSLNVCSNKTGADNLPKPQSEISQSGTIEIESRNQDKAIELYVNVLRN